MNWKQYYPKSLMMNREEKHINATQRNSKRINARGQKMYIYATLRK